MKKRTHKEIVHGWHPFTEEEINRYVAKGLWCNLTVCDLLDRNAEMFPDKLALVDDTEEQVTWRALLTRTNRMALHLQKLGVEYGDFFVLQMTNVVEFFYLFFGLNRIGAIPVMCLPRHRMLEVNHLLKLHRAKGICVMIGEKFDYVAMVEEIKRQHPYLKVLLAAGGKAPEGWLDIRELMYQEIEKDYPVDYLEQFKPDPNDICCEQLSGGTTGLPKGIPRTHNEYICQWDAYTKLAGYTEESICLVGIPVAHNATFNTMSGPALLRGGTMILAKSPRPKEQFQLIEKNRVTYSTFMPVQISYWMEADEARRKHDLSSLRIIGAGGQKLRPELARWCLKELGVNLVNHFGMAEGITIANRWDSPMEPQENTIGFPHLIDPDLQVKIVNDKNRQVGIGETGEMIVKGPTHFKGYFRNQEQNKKSFDDEGFFHSGDLMSQREDGRFVVEGRKGDMIIRGGENVYPEPVEDFLVRHPKIIAAAAVGMPDTKLGERLCAFIQPRVGETITFEEVQQYMREQGIAVFQWPERVEVVKGWPLTPVNKIDKRRLRAYITTKSFEEGKIEKEFGDEYLKRDKLSIDDVTSGRIKIEFTGTPK